jgi:SOS response regulatory protein OraA/RecX
MQSLTHYMKKELIFYIKQEYEKGHSLTKIREALLEGGHHKDLVKEAMSALKKHDFNVVKALDEPIKKHLDKELYYDIMNSLIRYVEFQLKKGYEPKRIKKILSDYGHSKDMIEQAFNATKKEANPNPWLSKSLEYGYLVVFALFLVFLSGSTGEGIETILFAFSPTIFSIIAVYVGKYSKLDYSFIWLAPVVLVGIFAILTTLSPMTNNGMEVLKLSTLNLGLSILFVYIKITETFNADKAIEELEDELQTKNDEKTKK